MLRPFVLASIHDSFSLKFVLHTVRPASSMLQLKAWFKALFQSKSRLHSGILQVVHPQTFANMLRDSNSLLDFSNSRMYSILYLLPEKQCLRSCRFVHLVWQYGLFNPYTAAGTIVVNGVPAAVHSHWFLDSAFDVLGLTAHLRKAYQGSLPGHMQLLVFACLDVSCGCKKLT